MTSKERLMTVFSHRIPDRIPIWLSFPFESEPFTADVNNLACYREVTEQVRKHQDFIERNAVNTDFLGDTGSLGRAADANGIDFLFHHPEVSRFRIEEAGQGMRRVTRRVQYRDVTLEQITLTEQGRTQVIPYLSDVSDIEKIMEFPYEIPTIDMGMYRKKAENLGDRGLHGIMIIDPLSVLHDNSSETDFSIWALTHTALFRKFLDFITPRMLEIYRQFLDQKVGETFFISGPEYVAPPLGSPGLFHELATGYNRQLVELIRSYGKKSILHCHGSVRSVLEEIAAIGPDALHPIEPSPMGDCTLRQARQALGEKTVLIGNIQYSDLAARGSSEIERMVELAIEDGGPGNFILSPSCSPYENQISRRVSENYLTMIRAGLKYGRIA